MAPSLRQTRARNASFDKYQIWTIKSDGTEQQKIQEENKRIYSPRWSEDGDHIYYLHSSEITRDLMRLEVSSITSDTPSKVIQTGLQAFGFSFTRDNKKLCYTKNNDFSNLWSFTYDEKTNLLSLKN